MSNPHGSDKLLSAPDLTQITEWNKDLPSPTPSCVHQLIEQHVRTQPNAPAICAWDGHYSYVELNALAQSLAHHLVQLGAGIEHFVPVCFEKSSLAAVSMVAVLKAGAACVFLEPAHPIKRTKIMLDDLGAKILLCSPKTS